MDFREREIDFREADRRYAELARRRDVGSISHEEFDAQRQQLVVQDDESRLWARTGEAGEWRYYDGGTWVQGTPPGYQEDAYEPTTGDSPGRAQPPSGPKGVENERRRMPLWIPVAGLGGMLLLGIVLVVWVLVPYLWGGAVAGEQGGSAGGEAAFDAGLVHRATSDNISANSTYLDDPLINDNPDAILYVTQNWNPRGDETGIYNDHPVGVWYDSGRERWAIFNQDREAMPDGAAFNVAVLEEPTGAR